MAVFEVGTSRLPIVPAYLTWGDAVTDPISALGSMSFDVVRSEQHERAAMVTDHSVESGINVVDHVRPLPDRLTLDVFVSNSPINSPDAVRAPLTINLPQPDGGGFLAGGVGGLIGQAAASFSGPEGDPSNPRSALQNFFGLTGSLPQTISPMVDQFFGDQDYVAIAYATLTALRDSATLLSVICPNAHYTDMIIENVEMQRDSSTGTSANMSIRFRQVRIVSSSVVDAPQPSLPRAQVSVNKGKTDASNVDNTPKASLDKQRRIDAGTSRAGSGL